MTLSLKFPGFQNCDNAEFLHEIIPKKADGIPPYELVSPAILTPDYSYRSASTGFVRAARMARKLTVRSAINSAAPPASANTHQPISTR